MSALVHNSQTKRVPTAQQFRDAVNYQLNLWILSNVEDLCREQTQTAIMSLVGHFCRPDQFCYVPLRDVEAFGQIIGGFRRDHHRETFNQLTDSEIDELIELLIPYFQAHMSK